MPNQLTYALVTAFITSAIYIVVLAAGLDLVFIFLASLPLFSAGFSRDPRLVLKAGAIATLPIALLTASPAAVLMFFLIIALPAWHICNIAMRYYDLKLKHNSTETPTLRLWYPTGLITIDLALYGCVMLATITAIFATQEVNLPQQITQIIQSEAATLSEQYAINIDLTNRDISFMICGITIWMWVALLLAHAWLANRTLIKKKIARRPSLMITPFPIPNWLLTFIGICALASLIGGESMRFLGKSCLIILMLPYFFQGLALIHIRAINWPNKRIFLLIMYISVILLFWPALIIAGIAFWDHIKTLNKHLSSGGTSSRS